MKPLRDAVFEGCVATLIIMLAAIFPTFALYIFAVIGILLTSGHIARMLYEIWMTPGGN